MSNSKEKTKYLSRRSFLKASTVAGVGTAIAGTSVVKNPKKGTAYAASLLTKECDEFPIELGPDFQQFNQKNTVFMRGFAGDPAISEQLMTYLPKDQGMVAPPGNTGYSDLEVALHNAAWSIEKDFGNNSAAGVTSKTGIYNWDGPINDRKTTFNSPEEATEKVKVAAKFLGADLVGIAKYEDVEKFVYSHWFNPQDRCEIPAEFPFKPKYVISLAYEMDYEGFKTAPSYLLDATVGNKYSAMAITSHKIAVFLRRLGYQAIPAGNDTAMSIPIAIQAGLGELSRMGILVTEKYGPRVRLSKVFTDLELVPDKPIIFGVEEFCKVCMKCADNCPSEAVPKDNEPSFIVPTISNISGVKKWSINSEKCFEFWSESGGSCGSCIAVCPYNKLDEWHHDLAKLATVTPGVRNIARSFDELFGYGKTYNEKAVEEFWQYKKD